MTRFTWLKILFSALLITVLVNRIGLLETLHGFTNADFRLLGAGLLFGGVQFLMQWRKWHTAAAIELPDINKKQTLTSLLSGMSLGLVTPGKSGEFGRGLFVQNGSKATLTALNFLDKLYSLMFTIVIGIAGLTFTAMNYPGSIPLPNSLLLLLTILSTFAVLFFVIRPNLLSGVITFLGTKALRSKTGERFNNISGFNVKKSVELFIYSAIFVMSFLLQYTLFALSLETFEPMDGFAALAASLLILASMPFFFGNIGIREFSAVFFLGIVGVTEAAAFGSALMLFLINSALPGIAGYFVIMRMKND